MPRLRLLADLATAQASGVSGVDGVGNPIFDVSAADLTPVVLDGTGFAGADSVTGSEWDADSGVTLSAQVLDGAVASCQAYIADSTFAPRRAYRVRNTMTLDSGPVRRTTVWLRAV